MTPKTKAALEVAREALNTCQNGLVWYRQEYPKADSQADDENEEAVTAALAQIDETLAEPELQPVAWSVLDKRTGKHWYTHESKTTAQHYANEYSHRESDGSPSMVIKPLYTAPNPTKQCAQCGKEHRACTSGGCPKCAPGLVVSEAEFRQPITRTPQPDWDALRHSANEWADMASNGLMWLRNIVDGISDPKKALACMEANLKHCREVDSAPAVQNACSAAIQLAKGASPAQTPVPHGWWVVQSTPEKLNLWPTDEGALLKLDAPAQTPAEVPEPQPVAWAVPGVGLFSFGPERPFENEVWIPLYTAPPAQTPPPDRKPLTTAEVKSLLLDFGYVMESASSARAHFINGLRCGEAAHGIKEQA